MHFLKGIFSHSALGTLAFHNDNEKLNQSKDNFIALVEGEGGRGFDTGTYNISTNFLTFLNVTTDNNNVTTDNNKVLP